MNLKNWIAFIGLGLAWGSSFFWNKIALQEVGPFSLVAIRLLLGLIGMLAGMLVRRPSWPQTRREWMMIGLLGLTNTAVPFSMISWSQQFIDSTVVSILVSIVPLFTAILAHFLVKDERLNLTKLAGVLLGFLGVVVLFWRGTATVGVSGIVGYLGVLGASFMFAVSAIIARRETTRLDPLIQSFISLTIADLVMWLAVLQIEPNITLPTQPPTWGALVWLGVVGSALAYHIYYYLIGQIGPTRTSMVAYVMPLVGLFLGVTILGEQFDQQLVIGAGLVLGSIWIVNRKKKKLEPQDNIN